MMTYRNMFFVVIFTFLSVTCIFASPTIIRDSRVSDTAVTPVLGRGYSIGTNTYQSTCMENVVITEPSYDFTYSFESMEDKVTTTTTTDTTGRREVSTEEGTTSKPQYSSNYRWGSRTYTWSKDIRNVYKKMVSKVGQFKESGEKKLYTHIVNVNIDLHSYYASVDESKSIMSENAAKLLTENDLAGFFSSCGPYYVRSIGRHAVFQSFFEYQTEDSKRDESFEGKLEEQIKGFRVAVYSYSRTSGGKTDYSGEWEGRRVAYSDPAKQEELAETFNEEASKRRLTITTMAYGLGKDQKATLISYDIDTFKAAIKDAFLSMQNPRTGKVEQIEVVPWVENIAFQNVLNIKDEDEYVDVLDSEGKPVVGSDGKTVQRKLMLYEKKLLMNENAEFIIEIDRVDRNIMNMYYKAKLCRRNIDMNWKKREGKKFTEIKPEYQNAFVQNKYDLSKTLPLKELDDIVSDARIKEILDTHNEFMYGTGGGASNCMREIMKRGIHKVSYREVEACQPVIENMGELQNDTIEHYCMPELAE
jgi:hypothetical protein